MIEKAQQVTMAMCQAGNRLRLTDYGELNGFVSKRTFSGKSPARRIAAKRSEEIPSGSPRYGSGLHTSSTALRDCPRTWVSRKREPCVKPRAVSGQADDQPYYHQPSPRNLTILK